MRVRTRNYTVAVIFSWYLLGGFVMLLYWHFFDIFLTTIFLFFQYLELRYNSRVVRLMASFSYIISIILYMGVVLYAPCLALHTITGIPVVDLVLLGGIVATFYTVMVIFWLSIKAIHKSCWYFRGRARVKFFNCSWRGVTGYMLLWVKKGFKRTYFGRLVLLSGIVASIYTVMVIFWLSIKGHP